MMITLFRRGESGETHYYMLNDRQGNLFTGFSFTLSWGKSLSSGRGKHYSFQTRHEMDEKIRELVSAKFKTGYRVLYSYLKPKELESFRTEMAKYSIS